MNLNKMLKITSLDSQDIWDEDNILILWLLGVKLWYDTDSLKWNEDYYYWEHRGMPCSIGNHSDSCKFYGPPGEEARIPIIDIGS